MTYRSTAFAAGLAFAAAAWPAGAQTAAAGLSLHALFERALDRAPSQQALADRLSAAEAGRDAAEAWLAAPPKLSAYEISDRPTANRGWEEIEVQVSAPLWMPGEGGAALRKAEAERRVAVSSARRSALEVAGALRAAVWDLVLARRLEVLAGQRLDLAAEMEREVSRRLAHGSAARIDLALAQADKAAAAAELEGRRSAVMTAREMLAALTDESAAAADPTEDLAEAAPEDDPRLAAARDAETLAREEAALARVADRDHPELGLIYRHNRDNLADTNGDYVGLQVSLPFSGPSRTAQTKAAEAEASLAAAERAAAERRIAIGVRQAESAMSRAAAQLPLARERRAAAAEHADALHRAYRLGEAGAAETIRARQGLNDADMALAEAEARLGRSRSELLQARGVLP